MYVYQILRLVLSRLFALTVLLVFLWGYSAHAQFTRLLTWEGNEDLSIACLKKSVDGYVGALGCPVGTVCAASNPKVLDVFSLHEDLSLKWRTQILLEKNVRSVHSLVVESGGAFWLLTDYGVADALFRFSAEGELIDQVALDEIGPCRFSSLELHPEGGVVVGCDLFKMGHYKDETWEWEKEVGQVEMTWLEQIQWTGTSFMALLAGNPAIVQFGPEGEIENAMGFSWEPDAPPITPRELVRRPDGSLYVVARYGNENLAIVALNPSLEVTDFRKFEGVEFTRLHDAMMLPSGHLIVLASGGSDFQYELADGLLFVFDEALNFTSGYRIGDEVPLSGQNMILTIAPGNAQQDFVLGGKLFTHDLGLWQFKQFDPSTHPVCFGWNAPLVPLNDGYEVELESYPESSSDSFIMMGEADVVAEELVDASWAEACTEGVTSSYERLHATARFRLLGNGRTRMPLLEPLANPGTAYEWALYSSVGQLVKAAGPLSGSNRLQLADLPAGIYFLQVHQGRATWCEKIQLN